MSEDDAPIEHPPRDAAEEASAPAPEEASAPAPVEAPRPARPRGLLHSLWLYVVLGVLFLAAQYGGWLPAPSGAGEEGAAVAEELTIEDLFRSRGEVSVGEALLVLVPLIVGSGMLLGYILLRACNVRVFPPCRFPVAPWDGWYLVRAGVVYVVLLRLALAGVAWLEPALKGVWGARAAPPTVLLALAANSVAVVTCVFLLALAGGWGGDPLRLLGLRESKPVERAAAGLAGVVMIQPLLLLAVIVVLVYGPMVGIKWEMQPLLSRARRVPPEAFLALSLSAVLIAPVTEEILFRGFLYATLRRYLGPLGAISLAAALFAAAHGHPPAFLSLFVLGFLLGYLYERTGSLVASIAAHAANNLYSMLILHVIHRAG